MGEKTRKSEKPARTARFGSGLQKKFGNILQSGPNRLKSGLVRSWSEVLKYNKARWARLIINKYFLYILLVFQSTFLFLLSPCSSSLL
ncbi:hypothetical protein RchiOBHm_Chr5g0019381 [Rosa chinensis]|uniref:Uncharacterized protein n=1 Tax=Rosa chinensis TaxID=74649 RepID=A0A2P6Q6Z2_ROSCH|nr:hypothetical protein RchiOBHm_Chr5g0019381 [Rosa chinensis]